MENKYFCPLPWLMMAIRNNGDLRVCCQANTAINKGLYRKDNGQPLNVNEDSIDQARNSELAKELRLSMINNTPHPTCIRCDKEDMSGFISRRSYENERAKEYFPLQKAIEQTNKDGSIQTKKTPLRYLDLRFGNRCNIKCRMCGPTDSDAWYDDHVKLWKTTSYKESSQTIQLKEKAKGQWEPINNIYNWIDRDVFWQQLEDNIYALDYIHTVGGEPLLIDRQFSFLEKCIKLGVSRNISLEYNTNGTVIPSKAWSLWSKFKVVKIGVSLDGIKNHNNYIRYPSQWETIYRNINRLDKAEGHYHLWFALTIQAYNILYLPDILQWKLEEDFERFNNSEAWPLLSTHLLHNPKHFSIKIFPREIKDKIAQRLRSFNHWLIQFLDTKSYSKEKKINLINKAESLIESTITYMNEEDLSHELTKFWNVTQSLDRIRNQDIKTELPELYELLRPYV